MKECEVLINDEFDEENSCDKNKNKEIKINDENLNNVNVFKTFKVYFYIKLEDSNTFIFPIKSDLLNINKQCVNDLIKNIVKKINDSCFIIKYNSNEYNLSLRENENFNEDPNFYINNYELRQCKKKTLTPKFDLPQFCPNDSLSNIIKEKISFISKNPLNIMLFNRSIDYNEDNYIKKENKNKNNLKKIKLNTNKKKYNCCFNKCIII